MNQNEQKEMRFVVLTQEILMDKELTPSDKLVLARITGFETFFESPASTAEMLGLTELIVQRAKRKLVAKGLVREIGNTGHGKIYQANLWKSDGRYNSKVTSDVTLKSHQILLESHTENKKRIYSSNIGESPVEKKKEFGRADINELEALWEKETGISIKGQQNQRRQLSNLVKKYGLDATKTLVKRVGVAVNSSDRFAPQIAVPSDLVGKYGKLPKLVMWEKRKQMSRSFGQVDAPPMAIANLKKGMSDYNDEAWDVKSDEERAKVSEMMRQARNRFKF